MWQHCPSFSHTGTDADCRGMLGIRSVQLVRGSGCKHEGALTRCKNDKLNNFGYGAILIAFSLEMIPLLQPQQILVDEGDPRDSHMMRQVALIAHHGGEN